MIYRAHDIGHFIFNIFLFYCTPFRVLNIVATFKKKLWGAKEDILLHPNIQWIDAGRHRCDSAIQGFTPLGWSGWALLCSIAQLYKKKVM